MARTLLKEIGFPKTHWSHPGDGRNSNTRSAGLYAKVWIYGLLRTILTKSGFIQLGDPVKTLRTVRDSCSVQVSQLSSCVATRRRQKRDRIRWYWAVGRSSEPNKYAKVAGDNMAPINASLRLPKPRTIDNLLDHVIHASIECTGRSCLLLCPHKTITKFPNIFRIQNYVPNTVFLWAIILLTQFIHSRINR